MGTFQYRIYGLVITANLELPHLIPATGSPGSDGVDVLFGSVPPSGELVRFWYREHNEALEFAIEPSGSRVWANWSTGPNGKSMNDATSLLAGPVLGGLLRLRQVVSLHASVIDMGGQAILLLADEGGGKSTLAATLAERGLGVLSDDVAAVVEQPPGHSVVHAGYPRLRLQEAVFGAAGTRPVPPDAGPVLTGRDKRYAALSDEGEGGAWRFHPGPLGVGAIYELERNAELDQPMLTALGAAERLEILVRHLRKLPVPLDKHRRASEFGRLARLAAATPMYRLHCPDRLDRLPEVCDLLDEGAQLRSVVN